MLAAASVITAANGLLGVATTQKLQLVDRLHHITAIETVRMMQPHSLLVYRFSE